MQNLTVVLPVWRWRVIFRKWRIWSKSATFRRKTVNSSKLSQKITFYHSAPKTGIWVDGHYGKKSSRWATRFGRGAQSRKGQNFVDEKRKMLKFPPKIPHFLKIEPKNDIWSFCPQDWPMSSPSLWYKEQAIVLRGLAVSRIAKKDWIASQFAGFRAWSVDAHFLPNQSADRPVSHTMAKLEHRRSFLIFPLLIWHF